MGDENPRTNDDPEDDRPLYQPERVPPQRPPGALACAESAAVCLEGEDALDGEPEEKKAGLEEKDKQIEA